MQPWISLLIKCGIVLIAAIAAFFFAKGLGGGVASLIALAVGGGVAALVFSRRSRGKLFSLGSGSGESAALAQPVSNR